ncbi:MAG: methyltransferase [Planctomycetales bacterium]
MNQPAPHAPPPHAQLMQFITGHWVTAALHSAARLDLADHLHAGPQNCADLARATDCHEDSLYRLLRALSSLGIFEETAPRTFKNTDVGECLRKDHPRSLRGMILFQGAAPHWHGWGSLLHSVRTGQSAFEHVHQQGFFDYCQAHPEFGNVFNDAMTGMATSTAEAVLQGYDFSGISKLIDVGGGHGYLISRILQKYPQLQGGLFDLPEVVKAAPALLKHAGVADRCAITGGSFFEAVPPADAYISSHIIHDWDDEHSIRILKTMRSSLAPNGRVLLVELVISDERDEDFGVWLDLEMLHATHGGRERTTAEYAELFAAAGLRLNRVVTTPSPTCVLEALPA